jgi:hypothetical protein
MARSIHDTWGVLERAKRDQWSDDAVPEAIVAEMKENLRRQRAIRESEKRLRKQGGTPPQPVFSETIPIFLDAPAPHLVHPASEEDIRTLLSMLPPGSLDGLQGIHLALDHEEARGARAVRDPFTGRLRREAIPGVFTSPRAGLYERDTASLRVFSLLCEPAALGPFAIYFRMDALRTLLHELAHHTDLTFRVGRSRWDTGDQSKRELLAEQAEREGSAQLVLPYLRGRYPGQCEALCAWIEEHGGTRLPLDSFLGAGAAEPAVLELAREVHGGASPEAVQIAFALRLSEAHEEVRAREILTAILARHPGFPGALAALTRLDEAEAAREI